MADKWEDTDDFVRCPKCNADHVHGSREDSSIDTVECRSCGHYFEVQCFYQFRVRSLPVERE